MYNEEMQVYDVKLYNILKVDEVIWKSWGCNGDLNSISLIGDRLTNLFFQGLSYKRVRREMSVLVEIVVGYLLSKEKI